ncbi:hypothetical protein NPIL_192891 [Nephila pilipes]|uniref:Uncharacterized protein n=1 Tax=Nephila pilipes TaxID=299642 RepID=A0A8X6NTU4_NEPPI|nr:hypothetical protein NPIL_192891 [Nephila pilipes]
MKQHFADLEPILASRPIFILKELGSSQRVFIRIDSECVPFQSSYEVRYEIKDRTDHYFTLLVNRKEKNISINRLKPCFCENQDNVVTEQPKYFATFTPSDSHNKKTIQNKPALIAPTVATTWLGRTVKFPSEFHNFVQCLHKGRNNVVTLYLYKKFFVLGNSQCLFTFGCVR